MTDPVFITGVGKRIGLALAKDFLRREIPVIGTYRSHYDSVDQLREQGAVLYACDFSAPEQVLELLDTLINGHPKLQTIIHNASDWLPDTCDYTPQQVIERMMSVHVKVPYQINLALAQHLRASNAAQKNIIHISDFVAQKGSQKHIAYAASKAALDNMTLSFAQKLAPEIRVNSISPSLIMFNENDDDVYRKKALDKSLLGIEAGQQQMLHAVRYLLESPYVTGSILPLNGGRHLK
ncbi:MAG: dihydromonapterin reductase [Cellvibrionaceae bacterium]